MSKEQNEILEALGKATNDMREYVDLKIGEVRSNGHSDPLTQESLDKANADIDELRSQLTTLQRPGLANASGSEDSSSESDAALKSTDPHMTSIFVMEWARLVARSSVKAKFVLCLALQTLMARF